MKTLLDKFNIFKNKTYSEQQKQSASTNHRLIGNDYEKLALQHCQKAGLKPVKRNYHCRQGELDLVMTEGNTLAIIEVRYRQKRDYGSALESVTLHKQKKIVAATKHFLNQYPQYQSMMIRFDVIAIEKSASQIHWVKNAFME